MTRKIIFFSPSSSPFSIAARQLSQIRFARRARAAARMDRSFASVTVSRQLVDAIEMRLASLGELAVRKFIRATREPRLNVKRVKCV